MESVATFRTHSSAGVHVIDVIDLSWITFTSARSSLDSTTHPEDEENEQDAPHDGVDVPVCFSGSCAAACAL